MATEEQTKRIQSGWKFLNEVKVEDADIYAAILAPFLVEDVFQNAGVNNVIKEVDEALTRGDSAHALCRLRKLSSWAAGISLFAADVMRDLNFKSTEVDEAQKTISAFPALTDKIQ